MRRLKKKKPGNIFTKPQEASFFPSVQTKLTVGKSGDKYEVEADKAAESVVKKSTLESSHSVQKKGAEEEEVQAKSLRLQKMETEEEQPIQKVEKEEEEPIQTKETEEEEPVQKQAEEEEEPIQTKEAEEEEPIQAKEAEEEETVQKMGEEEEPLQAKEAEDEEPVQKMGAKEEEEPIQAKPMPKTNSSIESRLKKSKGKGQKLPKKTRIEMKKGFGTDFKSVRIHTDQEAVELCKELGAQAFTHGKDIYFNEGKYNPNSDQGKLLLAHELTHTVQQGAVKPSKK